MWFLLNHSRIYLKPYDLGFIFFLTKKSHPNTLKSSENFKTPQLKIFSITVDSRVLWKMLSSITVDFKWVFKIHVWITVICHFNTNHL